MMEINKNKRITTDVIETVIYERDKRITLCRQIMTEEKSVNESGNKMSIKENP